MHFDRSNSLLFSSPMVAAPVSQTCAHRPQPLHFSRKYKTSGLPCQDSGLAHHLQRSGQPLKKTVLRIPSPSLTDQRWIWKMFPLHGFIGCSFNDRVLSLPGQVDELGAVTGDPNQHIPVVLWMFLRFVQHFGRNHVKLNVKRP